MELTGLGFCDWYQQRCKIQVTVIDVNKALNCGFHERVRVEILFALHIDRLLCIWQSYTFN